VSSSASAAEARADAQVHGRALVRQVLYAESP
jgi:hypothetical protein